MTKKDLLQNGKNKENVANIREGKTTVEINKKGDSSGQKKKEINLKEKKTPNAKKDNKTNTNGKTNTQEGKEKKEGKPGEANNKKKNDKKEKNSKNIEKKTSGKQPEKKAEEQQSSETNEVAATTTEKENVKLIKWEEIKNIFQKKKKIPKEELKKINKPVFQNIIVAIILMVYFIFLMLGFYHIENSVYQTDLKVFSLCILFGAILLLEKAYKEDSGKIAVFGIEAIVLAVITLGLIYVNLMASSNYINIVLILSYIIAIYYVIKCIVIYHQGKKKYFVDDMKEIMDTDE